MREKPGASGGFGASDEPPPRGDPEGIDEVAELVIEHDQVISSVEPGRILPSKQREEAVAAHRRAVEIFRQAGDRHREGQALDNLGLTLRQARLYEEAVDAHRRAVEIFRQAGDRDEADALGSLGIALQHLLPPRNEVVQLSLRSATLARIPGRFSILPVTCMCLTRRSAGRLNRPSWSSCIGGHQHRRSRRAGGWFLVPPDACPYVSP
jgi:hypothetical protein